MNQRHLVWLAVGIVAAPLLLFAAHAPVAIAMLIMVAAIYPLWRVYGGREVWVGIAMTSAIMTAVLVWAAVTSSGCPEPGTELVMKLGKAPVTCDQIRASYASMAAFFAMTLLVALAIPGIARRWDRDADAEDDTPPGTPSLNGSR
jgi:hypothetical protein